MRFLSFFPIAGLLLIMLLIGFKSFTLKRKGIKLQAGKSNPTGINLMLYPMFILLLMLWLIAIIGQTFNIQSFPNSIILTQKLIASPLPAAAGAVVIIISVLLMGITLAHFKTSLRFGLNRKNQGKLITKGIFAYSRNPFFLSLNFYFIGQALIFPGILFIAIMVMAVTGIHLFILKEEKFLHMYYGKPYANYMQRVRRYF